MIGACFTNGTGSTLSSFGAAYTGEQWRLGAITRADRMDFQYSLDATSLSTGTWVDVDALDFSSPDTGTVGAKNGNATTNRTALASTVNSVSIANGATFCVRWNDLDATGADDGLSVDDFSITFAGAALPTLSINDVTQVEGNAGTTNFTFTVSLSAPAPAAGVPVNYATSSDSATSGVDLTATSGTGTITNDDIVITSIGAIQGSGELSTRDGQLVMTEGVVTAKRGNGFFLQSFAATGEAAIDGAACRIRWNAWRACA